MAYYIKSIYDCIGIGNVITIFTFIIGLLFATYLTFKSFYRLVYSDEIICKDCTRMNDWKKKDTLFESRILFYNNGRKTLSKEEVKQLEISSTEHIKNVKILKAPEKVNTKFSKNKVNIKIEYLDSSDFILLEVSHTGILNINVRISETGKALHTEPPYWLVLNLIYVIFFLCNFSFEITKFLESEMHNYFMFVLNVSILLGVYLILRYIHKLLFIPDKLISKYLSTKDKLKKEFKTQL